VNADEAPYSTGGFGSRTWELGLLRGFRKATSGLFSAFARDSHKVRDVPQDILGSAMRENFFLAHVGPIPVPHRSSPCLIKRAIDRTANYNRSSTTSRCYCHHMSVLRDITHLVTVWQAPKIKDTAVTLVTSRDPRSNPNKFQIPSPSPKSHVAVRGQACSIEVFEAVRSTILRHTVL
jgi:hypothetical protein